MSQLKILICDDDPIVHESLKLYLLNESFECFSAYDGEEGIQMVNKINPSLIILDLMMPKMNGIEVCKHIRKASSVPIIMLTAKGEEIDQILGFELGADDYILKPFSPRAVVARVKAVCRRTTSSSNTLTQDALSFGPLTISLKKYQVLYNEKVIMSTPKEVEILHLLASNPGQVYSREQILNRIWGYDFLGDTRTIDTHIKRIRAKLPDENEHYNIQTIYGVGYKFEML